MSSERRAGSSPSVGAEDARALMTWRAMSALFLLAMGGIHLFLVLTGTGGLLGVLFVLNAVGSIVLAVAMIRVRDRLVPVSVLGLLFMLGTLLALLIALSPLSLFGMRSSLSYQLAPTAIVVEAIGVLVLAATVLLAARKRTG
ncbi:hypothetical protein [Saccharopolyspora tripterygii]